MGDSNPPDSPDTHAYNRRLLQKPDRRGNSKAESPPAVFHSRRKFFPRTIRQEKQGDCALKPCAPKKGPVDSSDGRRKNFYRQRPDVARRLRNIVAKRQNAKIFVRGKRREVCDKILTFR